MFGVKQIMDFVEKTGKTKFTIKELARTRKIKEDSAKRYVHEAQRFGFVTVKNNRVIVDPIKMTLLKEVLWGLEDTNSLIRFLRTLEKKGLIKNIKRRRETDAEATVEQFKLILPEEMDKRVVEKIKESIEKENMKVIALVIPQYLVTDVYLLLRNRLNLPPNSLIELSKDVGIIFFEKKE